MLSQILWIVGVISLLWNGYIQCEVLDRYDHPKHMQQMETITSFAEKHHTLLRPAPANHIHRVMFAIKQNNLEEIDRILWDVSMPSSENYGKHLTKQEVMELIRNEDAIEAVRRYLKSIGAEIVSEKKEGHYIYAEAEVSLWEEVFLTRFYQYERKAPLRELNAKQELEKPIYIRAKSYTLPEELNEYVESVFKITQFPALVTNKIQYQRLGSVKDYPREKLYSKGYVTLDFLNTHYSVKSNTGNDETTQAIFSSLGQYTSPSDLTTFQDENDIDEESIAVDHGGHVRDKPCEEDSDDCSEANLDIQYMMGIAQNIPTTHYYYNDTDGSIDWSAWAAEVADMDNPPKIFSISYSSYEDGVSTSGKTSFATEVKQLGVMGITVLAASGDDGVAGFLAREDEYGLAYCGYNPQYPASCPYVTAVGGTEGPESGLAEIAAQSTHASSITTGGGTSNYYTLPSWQADYVNGYFETVEGTNQEPEEGYSVDTRGYPDISLLAHAYVVVIAGDYYLLDGTSASTPTFAGMVSLVNAARVAGGNSTLGWFNPALYNSSANFVVDITDGVNNCLTSGNACCTQGFNATSGWDPVTGLGVVNFAKFYKTYTGEEQTADSDDDSSSSSDGLSTGAIAGIAIGGAVVGFALFGGAAQAMSSSAAAGKGAEEAGAEIPTVVANPVEATANPISNPV